jgi:pimeloyl-ACP methyl ester carboxylesterase
MEPQMPFVPREVEARWVPLAETTIDGSTARVMHDPQHVDGPVLLMMHGLEEYWQVWLPIAEILHNDYRILAADLPWRSRNDYDWTEIKTPSEWLAALIDALPVDVDVLFGHSFGSNTSLEYMARRNARQPRAAVLTAPLYRPSRDAVSWQFLDEAIKYFRTLLGAGLEARSDGRELPPEVFDAIVGKLFESVGPMGLVNLFRLVSHSPQIELHRILAPTLVIAGKQEHFKVTTHAGELAERLPNGSLAQLSEYHHFCVVMQAQEVAELAAGSLAAHLGTAVG